MNLADSIFIGCDNDVNVKGLATARAPSTYIDDATITFHVFPTEAAAIAYITAGTTTGTVANGTCSYIASSNGDYVGTLDDATALTNGLKYYVAVKVDAGAGRKDGRVLEYTARLRGTK
jgi:hypothetical protein